VKRTNRVGHLFVVSMPLLVNLEPVMPSMNPPAPPIESLTPIDADSRLL
jgi:hypothetical protein